MIPQLHRTQITAKIGHIIMSLLNGFSHHKLFIVVFEVLATRLEPANESQYINICELNIHYTILHELENHHETACVHVHSNSYLNDAT